MSNPHSIPFAEDEEAEWKQLRIALRNAFTNESAEAGKPHHAGYSFIEALYLATKGGTAPLARWIRDPRARPKLTDQDWKYAAVVVWLLQKPYKRGRGRAVGWSQRPAAVREVEQRIVKEVERERRVWLKQHLSRSGAPRQRVPSAEMKNFIKRAITQEKKASRVAVTPQRVRALLKESRLKR